MNELKEWSVAVCMTALACTAVRLLAPKQGSGRLFRLITASVFLCSLLVPLFDLYGTLSLNVETLPPVIVDDALETRVWGQLEKQVKSAATELIIDALAKRDITAQKILVDTDISEDGRICIKQVTVHLDKQHEAIAPTIQGVLERTVGASVKTVIGE